MGLALSRGGPDGQEEEGSKVGLRRKESSA